MDILWWAGPALLAVILVYLLFRSHRNKQRILTQINLLDSQIIAFDGQPYRYLGADHRHVFVEDFHGKVSEKTIRNIKHISKPQKTLVFYLPGHADTDFLYHKVKNNPFLPASAIALCEEVIAGTQEKRMRLCIKGINDFQKIKHFLQYIQSHLQ